MPSLNYLQGMAGRFGRGANTLGSMEDPRARFAQQLAAEGMDTSPAFAGEGISRLGKALVGALLMKRSREDQADFSRWLNAKMPDRMRKPTDQEVFKASPELDALQQVAMRGGPDISQQPARDKFATRDYENILGDFRERVPDTDDVLMKDPRMTPIIDKLSRYGPHVEDEDVGFGTPFKDAVDTQSADFNETLSRLREESTRFRPRDYAQELATGMEAYRSDPTHQISDPYTRMEWLRESARGLEGNPFVSRMLQNLMFAEIARDDEEALYQRRLKDERQDRKTASDIQESQFERTSSIQEKRLKQQGWKDSTRRVNGGLTQRILINPFTGEQKDIGDPYDPNILSPEALGQKKTLRAPTRPKTVTTAEGVYILNDDNSLGERLGSPHSQFGYPASPGQPTGQQQPSGQPSGQPQPVPQQTGGIPIHPEKPWERLPIRNQGAMQQEVHKTSRAMLEKNRQSLAKQKTMRDSLARFKYLNALQTEQAKDSLVETATGSIQDRMTEFSFDDEKREMVKIQNLLTPQMRQGLPGAASDRDVAMFRGATVGIDATQEINDNIIAGALARIDNAEDRQSFMEEYFQVNQHLDGAETYWKRYLEANPIFDHSPELVGSYTLNKNRQGYREFFGSSALSKDKKKRLEELRRKARGQ